MCHALAFVSVLCLTSLLGNRRYDAEFYLTLVDCNDGPANKSNAPYLEWKNSVGAPKSQESEQSITEIWNAKVDRLNAVSTFSGTLHAG